MKRLAQLLGALIVAGVVLAGHAPRADAITLGVEGKPQTFRALKSHGFKTLAAFEAWSNDRSAKSQLDAARGAGAAPQITWEPWRPPAFGVKDQGAIQPRFSNASIVAGKHDAYIRKFAKSVAAFRRPVVIRYAHEFPGFWYPWNQDAATYRAAWRHIYLLFRRAGARNARFVWAPQLSGNLLATTQPYWPGAAYVDRVGTSFIYFGRAQGYYPQMIQWLGQLRQFGKPVMLAEANVERDSRYEVMQALADYLKSNSWIREIVWSQSASRGQSQYGTQMKWSLARDPRALAILTSITR
jgi:beta-mannanase